MSLINQMLRDLQQQKEGGIQAATKSAQRGKKKRLPALPRPLVFGGVALLLLCFVWWMAGALPDLMFGIAPETQNAEIRQAVVTGESDSAAGAPVVPVEDEPLTPAEREAEPPVAVAASQRAMVIAQTPSAARNEVRSSPEKAGAEPPVAISQEPAVKPPAKVNVVKPKQANVLSRKATQKRPVASPRKVVAQEPKRLHPDDLPGAVKSSRLLQPEVKRIERRPRGTANTPYGLAEEAYLDAKWAFERERVNLAMRSLQDALDLYPGFLPARELLVKILRKEGKNGEAMFLLAEGLEIAPDYITFKKSYARLLMDQGDYDAATKVMLNGGLPTVTDDPEAHVLLASLYQRLDEPFLAAQTYRNLLVAWPQTGAFWVGLGGALEGQGLASEAAECYQKALKTARLRQDLLAYAKRRLSVLR